MPTYAPPPPEELNLESTTGTYVVIECGGFDQLRAEAVLVSGTWAAGRIRLQHTISGINWYDLDDPVEFSAEDMSVRIPLDGAVQVRALVTVAQLGTACLVNIYLALTGSALENAGQYYAVPPGSFS